eukprot:1326423-Karenia_brevis.AAC.1
MERGHHGHGLAGERVIVAEAKAGEKGVARVALTPPKLVVVNVGNGCKNGKSSREPNCPFEHPDKGSNVPDPLAPVDTP